MSSPSQRWPRPFTLGAIAESIFNELVALHDREYRVELVLLETLVDGALPRVVASPLRDPDNVRLAHALLSYPTWRTALTGPARRRAPRLVAAALRSAVL